MVLSAKYEFILRLATVFFCSTSLIEKEKKKHSNNFKEVVALIARKPQTIILDIYTTERLTSALFTQHRPYCTGCRHKIQFNTTSVHVVIKAPMFV